MGETIKINDSNYPLYKKIIQDYEDNSIKKVNGKYLINGVETSKYTFKQDYYWMMGDNRHGSEDSRFWGFVPENHILGKPVFIWFSVDNFNKGILNWKIRWDRIMTTVKGEENQYPSFSFFNFDFWLASFELPIKKKKKLRLDLSNTVIFSINNLLLTNCKFRSNLQYIHEVSKANY